MVDFTKTLSIKLATLLFLLIYILITFKVAMTGFHSDDFIPTLIPIDEEKAKEIPMINKIVTGLYIKRFSKFDLAKNDFTLIGIMWFKFNKYKTPIESIENLSIENGKITFKSHPDIQIRGEKTFVKYNVE